MWRLQNGPGAAVWLHMVCCNKMGHSSCAPFHRLTEGGAKFRLRCLCMESRARPAALALMELQICACKGAFLCSFPETSFVVVWDYEEDEWMSHSSSSSSSSAQVGSLRSGWPLSSLAHMTESQSTLNELQHSWISFACVVVFCVVEF